MSVHPTPTTVLQPRPNQAPAQTQPRSTAQKVYRIDNARHVLVTSDLSGLKRKADDDMNDIMSVLDQIST
jgi:hypothetical protein